MGVTETLLVADTVDLQAFAHPDAHLSLNDKISRVNLGKSVNAGIANQEKAAGLKAKIEEHKAGDGVFKRGSC